MGPCPAPWPCTPSSSRCRPEKVVRTKSKAANLEGKRFGRLRVLSFAGHKIYGRKRYPRWLCKCDCGSLKSIQGTSLVYGLTKSCGCLLREVSAKRALKHGHGGRQQSPTYRSWHAMTQRCSVSASPRNMQYYFERGIRVCRRWHSFAAFLLDMGPRPSGMSLDRVKNGRGYSKANCRWVPSSEQTSNTRRNVFIVHEGKRRTIAQWARELGVSPSTIASRIRRGSSREAALRG